jgi:hypothetical protein
LEWHVRGERGEGGGGAGEGGAARVTEPRVRYTLPKPGRTGPAVLTLTLLKILDRRA